MIRLPNNETREFADFGGQTLGDLGLRMPFFHRVPATNAPRLATLLMRAQQNQQPVAQQPAPQPMQPAAQAPQAPAKPMGASLGQLFSGYGY